MYNDLYLPYYNKSLALATELKTRENEIAIIVGTYDENGGLLNDGIQSFLKNQMNQIQSYLNFPNYLGTTLWQEFSAFRRDGVYQNDNYISDGLSDAEIFKNAQDFYNIAKNDIYKSAMLQHSINTDLHNLLLNPKFNSLINKFKLGNWIRVLVNDQIYKLRLVKYEFDYDDLATIPVEFSDVKETIFGMSDKQSLLSKVSSMTTSYDSVKRQANKGEKVNGLIHNWVNDGLKLTNQKIINDANNQNITWDSHGFLCRKYNPILDEYEEQQLKIINSGLYITDDKWLTAKVGVGNFIIWNPDTKQEESRYGVIADTLVANYILGQNIGIYNTSGSIKILETGVHIIADGVSGNNTMAFTIGKTIDAQGTVQNTLSIDTNGDLIGRFNNLTITGEGGNVPTNSSMNTAISNAVNAYDDSLNQAVVFNKLTDNGALQGLFMQNNQLYINASYIKTGTLSSIVIQNGTAVNGVYPFSVDANGNMVANSANITGTINATSGYLGSSNQGWTINTNAISYGTYGTAGSMLLCANGTTTNKSIGGSSAISGWTITAGANFGVTKNGDLYANSATITGKIFTSEGTIGGWTINTNSISSTPVSGRNITLGNGSNNTGDVLVVRLGTSSSNYTWPFVLRADGYFEATNAKIVGTITSSNATITGGSINIITSSESNSQIYLAYKFTSSSSGNTVTLTDEMRARGLYITASEIPGGALSGNTASAYAYYQGHLCTGYVNGIQTWYLGVRYSGNSKKYYTELTMKGARTTTTVLSLGENDSGGGGVYCMNSSGSTTAYINGSTGAIHGMIENTSDRRLKQNIEYMDADERAEFTYKLKPVSFEYISDSSKIHHGLIYQDVVENVDNLDWALFGELDSGMNLAEELDESNEHYKTLSYMELIADLIATVQSQNERIKRLEQNLNNNI